MEFDQAGSSMQGERGSGWMPGLQENPSGTQFLGPPSQIALFGVETQGTWSKFSVRLLLQRCYCGGDGAAAAYGVLPCGVM